LAFPLPLLPFAHFFFSPHPILRDWYVFPLHMLRLIWFGSIFHGFTLFALFRCSMNCLHGIIGFLWLCCRLRVPTQASRNLILLETSVLLFHGWTQFLMVLNIPFFLLCSLQLIFAPLPHQGNTLE
jgi:hypothetical protein